LLENKPFSEISLKEVKKFFGKSFN